MGQFSYLALAMMRAIPILAEASVLAAGAARLNPRPVFATVITANISLGVLYAGIGSISQDHLSVSMLFLGGIGVPAIGILVAYVLLGNAYGKLRRPRHDGASCLTSS